MEAKQTSVKFRHVGSFSLLLLLSVFQPRSVWPEFSIPFVPLVLLVLGLILFYKVWLTIGIKGVWQKYRVELGLFAAYEAVCFISLFLNRDLYPTTADFIRWGLTFPIFQMSIPMAALLFVLPQNERGVSLTQSLKNRKSNTATPLVALTIAFCVMATWQHIDYASAWEVFRFSIADNLNPAIGDIRAMLERNPQISVVSSFFAINTDLGAIASVVGVFTLALVLHYKTSSNDLTLHLMALMLFIFVFSTGILSEGRVFLVGSGVGILATLFRVAKQHKLLGFQVLIALILFAHLLMLFLSPLYHEKMAAFLPYLNGMYSETSLNAKDFIPNFDLESFGHRAQIWSLAANLVQENYLFGVSNGYFRLLAESLWGTALNNAHNVYLQVLIDSGIIGSLILATLAFRIIRKLNSLALTILLTAGATLLVDNFTDHSLSWIIVVIYLICSTHNIPKIKPLEFGSIALKRLHMSFTALSTLLITILLTLLP